MKHRLNKAFRDKTTWYAYVRQDGAGDKVFLDGQEIPCIIDGSIRAKITNISSKATIVTEGRESGQSVKAKIVLYFNQTKFPLKMFDEIDIRGERFPILEVDTVTCIKNNEEVMGVAYL